MSMDDISRIVEEEKQKERSKIASKGDVNNVQSPEQDSQETVQSVQNVEQVKDSHVQRDLVRETADEFSDIGLNAIASHIAKRFNIPDEIARGILADIQEVSRQDPSIRPIARLTTILDALSKARAMGPVSETAADMATSKVVPKLIEKTVSFDDVDIDDTPMKIAEAMLKRLLGYKMAMDVFERVFPNSGVSRQGDQSIDMSRVVEAIESRLMDKISDLADKINEKISRLEREIEEKKTWSQFMNELRSIIKESSKSEISSTSERLMQAIERINERLNRLEEEREKREKEDLLRMINEVKNDIAKEISMIKTNLSSLAAGGKQPSIEDIFTSARSRIEELEAVVREINNIKGKMDELMKALGRSPEAEALKSEIVNLRRKLEDIESKASMSNAIKEIINNPKVVKEWLGTIRDIAGTISEIERSVASAGNVQAKQQASGGRRPPSLSEMLAKGEAKGGGGEGEKGS